MMAQLNKLFYLKLYLFWLTWVTVRTLLGSIIIAILSAVAVYVYKGFAPLSKATFFALKEIVYLSFPIGFSLSFILVLLLVFKALFSRRVGGLHFILYDCKQEAIDSPLFSDVISLWRKWLFITVWMVLLFSVLFIGISKLFFGSYPSPSWFNASTLYLLVVTLGGGAFVLVVKKCKKIGIKHE